jgi:hypothetical protein
MSPQIESQPPNLDKLLEQARPELDKLEDNTLQRPAVARERAVELTKIVRDSWAGIVAMIDAELSPERAALRKAELAGLDDRAWVFYAADLRASEPDPDAIRARRSELSEQVAGHDRTLMMWAAPLFHDDPARAETLQDISPGTGRRDSAEDVLRLVELFRGAWDQVGGQTPVDEAMLAKAEADAAALLNLLRGDAKSPARLLATQAYTAWARDYDELVDLGRYLTRHDADSSARFPGIHAVPRARAGTATSDNTEDDTSEGDTPEGGT